MQREYHYVHMGGPREAPIERPECSERFDEEATTSCTDGERTRATHAGADPGLPVVDREQQDPRSCYEISVLFGDEVFGRIPMGPENK